MACDSKVNFSLDSSADDEEFTCPTGYILVPGDNTFGTTDFCIMRYEAKAWQDDNGDGLVSDSELDEMIWNRIDLTNWSLGDSLSGTHLPASAFEKVPWMLSAEDAWSSCLNLNSEVSASDRLADVNGDGTYALTSNDEWMTLAYNVENQAENWSSGVVGVDCLKQGNSDANTCNGNASAFAGADPINWHVLPSGHTSSNNDLAKLILNNQEEIWDMAGNVSEWIDFDASDSSYTGINWATRPQAPGGYINQELQDLNSGIDQFTPLLFLPADSSLDSSQGVGTYVARQNAIATDGGALARGGDYADTSVNAGLYRIDLGNSPDRYLNGNVVGFPPVAVNVPISVGFRCVFRP